MVTETFWYTVFTINKVFFFFLSKFGQIYQNCRFKMKFSIQTNSNMLNLMVMMFTFSAVDQKYPFWTNLPKKSKLFASNETW